MYKYICKMYKLCDDLQLKFVEKQDLYGNNDEFQFFCKKFLYLDSKFFIFYN